MSDLHIEFPVDHPCADGHFPGNPIIPGALLLAAVLDAVAAHLALDGTWQVKSAKFPQPVRPGEQVQIDYSQTAHGDIRFDGTVSGNKVLAGVAYMLPTAAEDMPS